MPFWLDEVDIAVFVILVLLGMIPYFWSRKKKFPASIYFLPIALLIFLMIVMKSSAQPYHPISIFFSIILQLFVIGIFMFWFFFPLGDSRLGIINKKGKTDLLNTGLVMFYYAMVFGLVYQGMSSLLGGISTYKSVELTPEFAKFYVPMITAILLIIYRVSGQIRSRVWSNIKIFSTTTIFAALGFYVFSAGARYLGMEMAQPLGLSVFDIFVWGVTLAIGGVFFEGILYYFDRSLGKLIRQRLKETPEFREKSILELSSPIMLFRLGRNEKHKTLKARKTLDKKVKRDFFDKHPRVRKIITIAMIPALIIVIYISIEKREVKVLVPTISVDIQILNENELSKEVEIFTADEIEGKNATSFAVRLINIQTNSISFTAPERTRYYLAETERFKVTPSGLYLLIHLNKGPLMEKTFLLSYLHSGMGRDQTENPQFNYLGLSVDAEIYYSLYSFGYNNLITFSSFSTGFEYQEAYKMIYAMGVNGDNTIIETLATGGNLKLTDKISIITLNTELSSNIEFLVKQTKLLKTVETDTKEPEMPF